MARCRVYESGPIVRTTMCEYRQYGFFNFMFDLLMVCITSGLWLIWIFVREMRNR